MKKSHLAATMVLACTLTAAAPASAKDQVVSGIGAMSCTRFAELRVANDRAVIIALKSWLQGLLSGMNMQLLLNRAEAKALPDADQIADFVDKHCSENPSSNPLMAAVALHEGLRNAQD